MAQKYTKKEIVKLLLKNRELDKLEENELVELLFNEPISIDVDKQITEAETKGDKIADKITEIAGSWYFIIGFVLTMTVWIIINVILTVLSYNNNAAFDPYPFVLLNLFLSCVAALQAPIIMMSQNRAAKKDSLRSLNDYKTDLKSELILEELHIELTKMMQTQNKILKLLEDGKEKVE